MASFPQQLHDVIFNLNLSSRCTCDAQRDNDHLPTCPLRDIVTAIQVSTTQLRNSSVMADVEIRDHPLFGRCAFACRAFAPGEVVIREEPLLVTANPNSQRTAKHELCLQLLLQEGGLVPGLADILPFQLSHFLAWSDASSEVQRKVLSSLLHTAECKDSTHVKVCAVAAGCIADRVLPRVPGLLPPDVCPPGAAREQQRAAVERVLLAWELNAHPVGNRCGTAGLPLSLHAAGVPCVLSTTCHVTQGKCFSK